MIRIASAPFRGRINIATMLNDMGLTGIAVEVGTHRGEFAAALRSRWDGSILHCVDPWAVMPSYEAQARFLPAIGGDGVNREADMRAARNILDNTGLDYALHRMTSREFADRTEPESLDFVFLDGDHEPPVCNEDVFLWWHKLRRGGVLAGHDVVSPMSGRGCEDAWDTWIQPAVFQFAAPRGLPIHLVPEEDPTQPWSYYLIKP